MQLKIRNIKKNKYHKIKIGKHKKRNATLQKEQAEDIKQNEKIVYRIRKRNQKTSVVEGSGSL